MKKRLKLALCLFVGISFYALPVIAEDVSDEELLHEEKSNEKREQPFHSVKGLEDRIKVVEEQVKEGQLHEKFFERISISGVIEVEANYESMDFSSPASDDTDGSDITLATIELGLDAKLGKHALGHVLFLWEEGDTEPVDIDEGFISIDGWETIPLYINAGKMYVSFGNFESHFVGDPLTLEIGETRESAVRAGFAYDMFNINISFFNGDIDEMGEDDKISTFVGSAVFTLPEGTITDLGLLMGISYISNIADSDGLEGEVTGPLVDSVGGVGFFLSASLMEKFYMEFEYLGATDKFAPGELSFDNGLAFKPKAYNLEFAWLFTDSLELGVKYEGGNDLGDFLPEKQYGCVLNYGIFQDINLGIEYLHGEYENGDERDLITAQLTIAF